MRTDLDEDPAVVGIAQKLGVSETQVVGWLWKLWSVASRQTANGWLPHYSLDKIDRVVNGQGFAAALESVGWLHPRRDGVELPHYEHWLSASAKKRYKEALKKRLQRMLENLSQKKGHVGDTNGTPVLFSSESPSSEEGKGGAGEGEKPPRPPPDFALSAEGLAQQWCFVLTRKRLRGPADLPDDVAPGMAELIRLGVPAEAIRAEIVNGRDKSEQLWQFRERLKRNHGVDGYERARLGSDSRVRAPEGKYDGIGTTIRLGGAGVGDPAGAATSAGPDQERGGDRPGAQNGDPRRGSG